MAVRGDGYGGEVGMKHAKARQVERARRVEGEIRRTRALGDYDKTARESQRRAAAYGRARGNS